MDDEDTMKTTAVDSGQWNNGRINVEMQERVVETVEGPATKIYGLSSSSALQVKFQLS